MSLLERRGDDWQFSQKRDLKRWGNSRGGQRKFRNKTKEIEVGGVNLSQNRRVKGGSIARKGARKALGKSPTRGGGGKFEANLNSMEKLQSA